MGDDLDLIKAALDSKLIEDVYEDGLSPAVKEASKIPVDLIKVARLFLAPIQLLGALQDRFERIVRRISQEVDSSRVTEAEPRIVGPILENLRYLPENDIIAECFVNLLCRAIDKDRKHEAHPGFVHVLENLSPDEAFLLYVLSKRELEIVDTMDLDKPNNRFMNRKIEKSEIKENELQYPGNFGAYYIHLESMGLVTWPVYKQAPINSGGQQIGVRRYSKLGLTEYGTLFMKACVPSDDYVRAKMATIRESR